MRIRLVVHHRTLDAEQRAQLIRCFQVGVARWADQIRDVIVRIEDVNGPKGGVGLRCQADALVRGLGQIQAHARGTHCDQVVRVTAQRLTACCWSVFKRRITARRSRPAHLIFDMMNTRGRPHSRALGGSLLDRG